MVNGLMKLTATGELVLEDADLALLLKSWVARQQEHKNKHGKEAVERPRRARKSKASGHAA
jgi:hypothetical protein